MGYDFKNIDRKWQKVWLETNAYATDIYDFSRPKYYVLDMFPYPSGQGLHVGHAEGYTATDVVARMKRMQGYNVLHPIGWDAFGLPAEQYALKTNNHPAKFTGENINHFREQIQTLGFSYDWQREINTTDPGYYRWTQWIFAQLFTHDLAFVDYIPVNFCPELGTVLANEEVVDGKSEVGGFPVIRKPMRQWLLKITAYSEKLLTGFDQIDWPVSTLEMQKNWIGRSEGAKITFKVQAPANLPFEVFTTRVDTLYGCTYCCLAPEHPLVDKITTAGQMAQVKAYQASVARKSDLDRTELNKDKSGCFTGAYAINPINQQAVPIYIADYVLINYGSGAVMAVPAHDQRDYEFAQKYHLPMISVLYGDISTQAMVDDGVHVNSQAANGLLIAEAKEVILQKLIKEGNGERSINYKLRDWLFSRQRYWGEPIPAATFDDNGKTFILPDSELPLILPDLVEFKPSGTGDSPLILAKDWLHFTHEGRPATRETNTMPQWAGSCWYYIRYLDPHNQKQIADPALIKHWLPVDLYIGGAEHAVLHLLYARFWHKFLKDIGVVDCEEPFKRLFHQGMILGSNGEKMSKSRGNVVSPDDILGNYGADTLRLYEMFMGPLEASLPWSDGGLDGAKRWLDRVERLFSEADLAEKIVDVNNHELDYSYHYLVKKVSEDFEALRFNTAISQMMIFINDCYKSETIYRPYLEGFVKMLACIAPHLGEELYHNMGHQELITYAPWPGYDPLLLVQETENIALQVNGKLRANVSVALDISKEDLQALALSHPQVEKHIAGLQIVKVIVVPHRIVNIVAK